MDPNTDAYIKKMNSESRAGVQNVIGYFVAGEDPDGKVTYDNLAMAEAVVLHSPDRCDVVFPTGRLAQFKTERAVRYVRRLIDRGH